MNRRASVPWVMIFILPGTGASGVLSANDMGGLETGDPSRWSFVTIP